MFYEPLIVNNIPYRAYVGKCKSCRRHWHSELELLICLEGKLLVSTETGQLSLSAGDAAILPGYEGHAVSSESADTRRIAIAFGYALLGGEFQAIQSTWLPILAHQEVPELLRMSLRTICRCLTEHGCVCLENEWQIRGSLCTLAGCLRTLPQGKAFTEDAQSRMQRLSSIYTVVEHVAQHYTEKISIEEAARIAGYATTYFCKQFRSIIGVSFHQYLTRYRISMACMLLRDSSQSVSSVAERTGFSSLKLFCRTFKEITGKTPTQYQSLSPEERDADWLP